MPDLVVNDRVVIPQRDLEFTYARSGGPGGQHVQTADTRVRLRFALERCGALRPEVKARLRAKHPGWLTEGGDMVLTCGASRSRQRNIEEVRERLAAAIRGSLRPPKRRRPTKATRGSKERRMKGKKERGATKRLRGRVKE